MTIFSFLAGSIVVVLAMSLLIFDGNHKADYVEIDDVEYAGNDFIKSCFSVGKESIYVCAFSNDETDYYIAKMPINGNNLERLSYEIPNDMKVIGMNVDSSEECSVLLSTFHEEVCEGENAIFIDFRKTRIDTIGADGILKNTLDTSEMLKNMEAIPLIFESDSNNNFYINDGEVLMHFSGTEEKIDKYPIDGYYETVMCEKGKTYTIYWDYSSEKTVLAEIKDGKMDDISELETLDEDYRSISMQKNDLYLYSREGLYKFCNNKQECIYRDNNLNKTRPLIHGEDLSAEGELCMLLRSNGSFKIRHIKIKSI